MLCARGVCQAAGASDGHHVGITRRRKLCNWVFNRRMVPVTSANDCQKCVQVCACACVRLCVCVSVCEV